MDKEQLEKLKKAAKKKSRSLPIQIMESDLYDHQPGVQMTLMVLALGTRTNEDAYVPPDCPYKDDMIGWCNMAQWRIALRAKKSESQVQRDIRQFRDDGVVQARGWEDDNHVEHLMYRIVPEVIKEHQRPSQTEDVKRPGRYKSKNSNRGHFSKKNQPERATAASAGVNEDDA